MYLNTLQFHKHFYQIKKNTIQSLSFCSIDLLFKIFSYIVSYVLVTFAPKKIKNRNTSIINQWANYFTFLRANSHFFLKQNQHKPCLQGVNYSHIKLVKKNDMHVSLSTSVPTIIFYFWNRTNISHVYR